MSKKQRFDSYTSSIFIDIQADINKINGRLLSTALGSTERNRLEKIRSDLRNEAKVIKKAYFLNKANSVIENAEATLSKARLMAKSYTNVK